MPESRQFTELPSEAEPLTVTVPRALVHRVSVAEPLLTGWAGTGPDRFTLTARWPRAGRLHVSADRSAYEPLLVAETVRQCGALLAHIGYEILIGHQFVLRDLRVGTRPERLTVGSAPAEPGVDITVDGVRHPAGRPAGLRYDTVVSLGPERVGTDRIAVRWANEAPYRRMRGGAPPWSPAAAPAPAGTVTGGHRGAVPARRRAPVAPRSPRPWVAQSRYRAPRFLRPPAGPRPRHGPPGGRPSGRSGARRSARPAPASFNATFHQFTEVARQVWIEVSGADGADVQVVALPGESVALECRMGAVAV